MRSPRPRPPPRCLRPRRGRLPTRRNSLSSDSETGFPVSSALNFFLACFELLSRRLLVFFKVFKITWSSSMETKLYCSSKFFSSSSSSNSISLEIRSSFSSKKSSESFSSTVSIWGMLFWMVTPMRRYVVIQPRQCMLETFCSMADGWFEVGRAISFSLSIGEAWARIEGVEGARCWLGLTSFLVGCCLVLVAPMVVPPIAATCHQSTYDGNANKGFSEGKNINIQKERYLITLFWG